MLSKIAGFIMSLIMFFCSLFGIGTSGEPTDKPSVEPTGEKSSVVVALEENATTGYRWKVIIADESIAKLSKDENILPEDTTLVGAPTTRQFTFVAVAPGKTTVTLSYERDWEEGAIRFVSVNLVVDYDLSITATVISDVKM